MLASLPAIRFSALAAWAMAEFACVIQAAAQTNPPLQWRPLHDPGVGGWVTSLSVQPGNPSVILAGGDILGVARSSNGGKSWSRPATPAGSYMIEDFTWHPDASDPASPHHGEVWAGTMSGPWKSVDFGQTWVVRRAGMPQPNGNVQDFRPAIQKILFDPGNPNRLLAFFGTHRLEKPGGFFNDSGKVYESTDGGENWTSLATIVADSDSKQRLITAAAYQLTGPGGATTLYAASVKGFYKSTNNGADWVQKSTGLPAPDRNIRSLAVHPADGRILWITISSAGVFKSTDAGETWSAANNGLNSPGTGTFDAIVVSPADGNLLFTSKIQDKKLYRSSDGGTTWVAQPAEAFGPSPYPIYRDVRCFAAHPTDAGVIFAGTPTDIWQTKNAGAADDLDSIVPYTGTFWANVSSVARNGAWAGTGYSGQVVNRFCWNPYNPAEAAIAALDGGKFVSRDSLQSWRFAGGGRGKGINDWFAFVDFSFSSLPGNWYAIEGQFGSNNGIFRTTDAGASWTPVPKPSVDGVSATGDPLRVHVHREDMNRVWVIWGGKLYHSTSGGVAGSWIQLAGNAAVYGTVSDLVADPADPTGNTLWFGGSKGLFRSTNGIDFTQVAPAGTAQGISRVKLDPTNPNRVWIVNAGFYSTNSYSTGLWRLTYNPADLTGTWSNLASWGNPASPVKWIVDVDVDPTNGSRIAVGTSQDNFTAVTAETGVWINDNHGATDAWRREVSGLGVQRVRTVNFRPGSGELVAGTMGGGYYISKTDGTVVDLAPPVSTGGADPGPQIPGSTTGLGSDAEILRTGSGDGGGTVANASSGTLRIGRPAADSAAIPVFVFQLPDLGAVTNPFRAATFSVGLVTSTTFFGGFSADVYGLGARDADAVLPGDAYIGPLDATDAVRISDNWINFNTDPPPATGLRTLTNDALAAYLNEQYAGGAGVGKHVFLRISPDSAGNTYKNFRFASAEYTSDETLRPRLSYTTSAAPNNAPVLPEQSRVEIEPLEPLSINNSATDADLPAQSLSYELIQAPVGASIDAAGVISWKPSFDQAAGTHVIQTRVTDNGTPALSDTNSLEVRVGTSITNAAISAALIAYALGGPPTAEKLADGRLQVSFSREAENVDYVIQVSSDLSTWTQAGHFSGRSSMPTVWSDHAPGNRFARIGVSLK